MTKIFNSNLYITLLRENKRLNLLGESLASSNLKQYKEFLKLQIILENNLKYNKKENYRKVIQKYLQRKIDLGTFLEEFNELEDQIHESLKNLNEKEIKNVSISPKSKHFGELIESISADSFVVMGIISESDFQSLIETNYYKL